MGGEGHWTRGYETQGPKNRSGRRKVMIGRYTKGERRNEGGVH